MDHLATEKVPFAFVGSDAALVADQLSIEDVVDDVDVFAVGVAIAIDVQDDDVDRVAVEVPAVTAGAAQSEYLVVEPKASSRGRGRHDDLRGVPPMMARRAHGESSRPDLQDRRSSSPRT